MTTIFIITVAGVILYKLLIRETMTVRNSEPAKQNTTMELVSTV